MEVKRTESLRLTWGSHIEVQEGGVWAVTLQLYNEAGVLAIQERLPFLSEDVSSVPVEFGCDPPGVASVEMLSQHGFIPLAAAKATFLLRITPTARAAESARQIRLRASSTLAPSVLRIMPVLSTQLQVELNDHGIVSPAVSTTTLSSCREVFYMMDGVRERLLVLEQPNVVGFFGVLWDSALVLSNFLLAHTALVRGSHSVVELGASTGLCSMLLKRINPDARVVATDMDDMIQLAKENMKRNGFSEEDVVVAAYQWGTADGFADAENQSMMSHAMLRRHSFDLVVASDVIFDPAYWDDLWRSFDDLLVDDSTAMSTAVRSDHAEIMAHDAENPSTTFVEIGNVISPKIVLVNRTRHAMEAEFFNHPASSKWNRVRLEPKFHERVETGAGGIRFEDTVIDILTRKG